VCTDKEIRESFKQELISFGYETILCYRGEEALRIIDDQVVDVLIFSVELQDMNGFEACRLVRQKFDFLSCPVVIHGPQDSDQLRLAAFRAGANIFMFAPIKFDRLHYVLSLLVNGRRRYKRSLPAEEFLRIVDREYCAGKEIEDCITTDTGSICKSDILRWTNILAKESGLSKEQQLIAHEMINYTLDLLTTYGSIKNVLTYLNELWAGTSIWFEFKKLFEFSNGNLRLDTVDVHTTDGITGLVLLLCVNLLSGKTPAEAISSLYEIEEINVDEVEVLNRVISADSFMNQIFNQLE
jgi:response regulator receiver domain protein